MDRRESADGEILEKEIHVKSEGLEKSIAILQSASSALAELIWDKGNDYVRLEVIIDRNADKSEINYYTKGGQETAAET